MGAFLKRAARRPPRRPEPLILVTGFGPFPGVPRNPSAALVEALPARLGRARLVAHVLPTSYAGAAARLAELIEEHAPDAVVHFGVSGRARGFVLERVARNRVLGSAPDQTGAQPSRAVVLPGAPARRLSTIGFASAATRLRRAGLPAALSDDAGAYVCNATLFASLGYPGAPPTGFVHIPPEGVLAFPDLLRGARIILGAAAQTRLRPGARSANGRRSWRRSPGA